MKKQYKIIKIAKGNGSFRTIYAPSKDYKEKLTSFLLDLQQKVHNADTEKISHGFMRGRGAVSNAQKHVGYAYTLSLDLKDFFDSVKLEMVSEYLSEEERTLCFIDGIARQGLPTSPVMANLAFLKIDQKIKTAIAEEGAYTVYTRYADDMFFSFNHKEFASTLERVVEKIITEAGFILHPQKRKLQSASSGRRMITGISVGERDIAPSRKLKRRIRAAIHQKNKEKAFGLLSWAECKEPRAFYTDRDLLNKNIFEEEALDLSNDFFLSDLLSFEQYIALVEGDFESTTTVHEQDREKWERQKMAFLQQREAFYANEKKRAEAGRKSSREKILKRLNPPVEETKPQKRKETKKAAHKAVSESEDHLLDQEQTSEMAVDFDIIKETELEEVSKFQDEKRLKRLQQEEKQQASVKKEETKRSMNKIFMMSLLPIIILIGAMSYYFGNTEVEIKPEYPLFVKATPYDARVQILNIKPKYKMGITLKPGKYDIRISKRGYKSQRFWITMEHEPVVVERELKKIKKRKVY